MSGEINKNEIEVPKVEPPVELSEPTLDEVVGGTARDAATGLATGKRMHKPFSVDV